jgi:hypothetical protein
MLKWLLKSLLILAVFVPFATALPVAALWLCRTPDGAQFLFWTGPWSCCFWVLIYSVLSGSKFWLGAEHVRQWRREQGGLLVSSMKATAWMFFGLVGSYAAEFLMLFLVRPSASGRALLPAATYSPIFICWCWRRVRG